MSWEWGSLILAGITLLALVLAVGGYKNIVKELRAQVRGMKTNPTRQDYDQCRDHFCKQLDKLFGLLSDMDTNRENARQGREAQLGNILHEIGELRGDMNGIKTQMENIQNRMDRKE
jgi:hypothetical protein